MTAFIGLEAVSFSWPRGPAVLDGLDLNIKATDTLALMGANGSGKTTLAKIIMGLIRPQEGRVLLAGKPVQDYSLAQRGRKVGYVFQNPERQFFAASVKDEIGFPMKFRGLSPEIIQERVGEMLTLFELESRAEAFPFNLSQGEKQRLALAATMALKPEFIILDEPSTGLDRVRKGRLVAALERVREQGIGFLLISHDHAFSREVCAQAMTLKGGRLE